MQFNGFDENLMKASLINMKVANHFPEQMNRNEIERGS